MTIVGPIFHLDCPIPRCDGVLEIDPCTAFGSTKNRWVSIYGSKSETAPGMLHTCRDCGVDLALMMQVTLIVRPIDAYVIPPAATLALVPDTGS